MPPAIIAAVASIASALVPILLPHLTALAIALITIAISIAATVAISLGKKPTQGSRSNQGQELKLKLDPGMARQVALGRTGVGGSVVWAFTYGSTTNVPTNAYLVRVIALSDLPLSGLVGIYEGANQLTIASDVTAGLAACSQHTSKMGTTCMWARVFLGSPTPTASADLISWAGSQWTTAHKGTNMAYAVVRYLYDGNGDAFPGGEPQLTFVVDGVKCYDQRQDGTRPARTGTQRLADPTTWAFTRNPAVLAQQVLRGLYSKGVLLLGAQAEDRDLNDDMLVSAYNTCDESVANAAGGTQARYQAGYLINSGQTTSDALMHLQTAMDGKIIDRGGAITLRPGATRTPVFNLTDNDILWDMEKSWQPRLNLSEIYNFVDGAFVDEQTIYQEKPFPTMYNAAWEAEDGGQRLEYQVSYTAVNNWSQVQRMTKRIHQQSRLQGTAAFFLPLWGIEMEQDDWFTWTSARFGFTNKYFVCVSADLVMSSGLVLGVVAREMAATIDGWNPAVDEKARTDSYWTGQFTNTLPTPYMSVTPIKRISTADQSEQYGISIVFTNLGATPGLATNLEIQIAPTTNLAAAVTFPGGFSSRDQTVEYFGLLPSSAYSVRSRTYSNRDQGNWSIWIAFTALASNVGWAVSLNPNQVFQANPDGTLNPAAQVPDYISVDVLRAGVSAKLNDSVSYSIAAGGCTATIDNTNGSATKGVITISAFSGWTAQIVVTVTAWGSVLPVQTIQLSKTVAAAAGGGTTGGTAGGTGVKTASQSRLNAFGTTVVDITSVMTVTLAAGESLYGTGLLSYGYNRNAALGLVSSGQAKWQYSVAGANTWTDFPSSPIIGDQAYSGGAPGEGYDGSADMTQTQGGLAAGNYDVKIVGRKTTGAGLFLAYGTMQIQAKV